MQKTFGIIAAIYGGVAVVLGAFGAHALKDKLDAYQHSIYEKAVSYQFYHVVALIAVVLLATNFQAKNIYNNTADSDKLQEAASQPKTLSLAGWFFTTGILLFSGSLYLLATRNLFGIDALASVLGPITPLGGLCFIIGWILLAISFKKL